MVSLARKGTATTVLTIGLLVVRITRAIESLPHIARAHVSRWGDGSAHPHIFFFARPPGRIRSIARYPPGGPGRLAARRPGQPA